MKETHFLRPTSLLTAFLFWAFTLIAPPSFAIDSSKIKVSGDARVRYEKYKGKDLDQSNAVASSEQAISQSDYTTTRIRIGADFTVTDSVSVFFQPQFVKRFGQTDTTTGGTVLTSGTTNQANNDLGMYQGYINWSPLSIVHFIAGRQRLHFGDGLLISDRDFHMYGQAFDGVRLQVELGNGTVDLFSSKYVDFEAPNTNEPEDEADLLGVYTSWDFEMPALKKVDFYFTRFDNSVRSSTQAGLPGSTSTYGGRIKSTLGDFDYRLEGMHQGASDHMGDGEVGYTFKWMDVRLAGGYFYASNDYNDPFSLKHRYMGYADLFSKRNLKGCHAHASISPMEGIRLAVDYHNFTRTNKNRTVYDTSNTSYGSETSGSSLVDYTGFSDEVGSEVDLTLFYQATKRVEFELEASRFQHGNFFKNQPTLLHTSRAVKQFYASVSVLL